MLRTAGSREPVGISRNRYRLLFARMLRPAPVINADLPGKEIMANRGHISDRIIVQAIQAVSGRDTEKATDCSPGCPGTGGYICS